MLKALELVGFKSFAGKTRFEFPRGITVVVGPNGSGKSNIVDAIKWVLGEQSVKSLRGREMADVIFNGSGSRRALNSAEVTLTLDNASGVLAVDTPEVHISRRVYRSGEGEYLINRQPCRLRDVRDLLAGTGLGTQAYSVIEQGKVDVLLQSSARDRRAIFEEAAGISRFKAKKLESLRRLERVEQNLLRLSDIVDEVDNRLRSVRTQASKARRYRDHASRLQELRTQVGLVDWRRQTERLAEFEAELTRLTDERGAAAAEAEALDARILESETRVGQITEEIRQAEARIAANRERIAAQESTIDHERASGRDLEQQKSRHRRQLAEMSVRAGDLEQQLHETRQAVDAAEEQHRRIARVFAEGERELTGLIDQLDQVRAESHQHRAAHLEKMRAAASLGNQISGLESRVAAAGAARERNGRRLAELRDQSKLLENEFQQLEERREELAADVERRRERLSGIRLRLDERRKQAEICQAELTQLGQRQSGLVERSSVLEELQERLEGVSPGVKEVLRQAKDSADGPFGEVRGLVADLLQVGVEAAALVEVALGQTAQHVVVAGDGDLLAYVRNQSRRFAGRVGFVWLEDGPPAAPVTENIDLEGCPGVLGRADRFVTTEPRYAPLAERLLGGTWMVERLADALNLAASKGPGACFVTLAGELLTADGTLVVGPKHVSAGLISRRSELRALAIQRAEIEARISETRTAVDNLRRQIDADRQQVSLAAEEHQRAVDLFNEHCHEITAVVERRKQMQRQGDLLEAELGAAAAEHDSSREALLRARREREQIESILAGMEAGVDRLAEQIHRLEAACQSRGRDATEIKVELAKSEERLGNLRGRMRQYEESRQERQRAIAESRAQLAHCTERAERAQWSILRAESEIAELYLHKEAFTRQTVEFIDRRGSLQRERSGLTGQAQQARATVRRLEEKIHAKQLAASEIHHERNSLAARLREDYGIELADLEHEPTAEEQHEREEVQKEIDELRRKINNLGNVNVEALDELEQLEGRFQSLSGQYKDLVHAKNSLQRIIDKINGDSRRLFTDTLETVKGHFGTLFRQLFGGGRADIVLDDEDVLECGIEIVAQPPGKELRSISLLSGGEKTLTCVALLLAIFRSRPSPFCVLDEVDAALDEANISRFTKVLEAFRAWTQFIIVTHSKKTMTAADTLYGVTMQESGVSKQVSVRFEDVSDDGEIRLPPGEADLPDANLEPDATADDDEPQAA
jgi:chromosome segregation protein